jgi:CRP-like cAMP-binding protein
VLKHCHRWADYEGIGDREIFLCSGATCRETGMNSDQASSSVLEPLVSKLGYWVELDAADRDAIRALPHQIKRLEQHHYIIRDRDVATHSCLLMSGFAVRHKIVGGGYRQIVAIHMKGDILDLQNSMLGTADHSVEMLTPGQIAMIPRDDVIRIAFERPNVGRAMWFDTLVDGSSVLEPLVSKLGYWVGAYG